MQIQRLKALFQPEQFQGWGKTRKYFEGWYYKILNAEENKALAIIPGISMNGHGERHAFVQVLDGKKQTARYHQFPEETFAPSPHQFDLKIGPNRFSKARIELQLPELHGSIQFKSRKSWPNRWYAPGIMGPFTFVPFMECYHGILSMHHVLEGQLHYHQQAIDFTGGKGYMEKDWGHSFPRAYIWMQSNHFSNPDISLKTSVAQIPWLGRAFTGLIAGLLVNGTLHEFTTYNFTRLRKVAVHEEGVEIIMENRRHRLAIYARQHNATELASPIGGFMDGRIKESMTATIEAELREKAGNRVVLRDIGRNAGLEIAGNVQELTTT